MIKVSDLDELGRKVRQLRTGRGMTQAALAKAAGTHQSAIAMMEKGSRRPPGRERRGKNEGGEAEKGVFHRHLQKIWQTFSRCQR